MKITGIFLFYVVWKIRNFYLPPLRKESDIENVNIFICSINGLLFYVVEVPNVYFINLNI
jgi:hypothetical protein